MQNLIDELTHALETQLHPTVLSITDDSEDHAGHAGNKGGAHLTLHIVSAQFEGKLPVARHRMIYTALDQWMKGPIHALSIQAQTPTEYISRRSTS
jgi:BolA protein